MPIKAHTAEVTGLSLHPTGDYIATSSMDGSWAFTDIAGASPTTLMTISDDATDGYSCFSFHPDGLLCGVGAAKGVVQIFDVLPGCISAEQMHVPSRDMHLLPQAHASAFPRHVHLPSPYKMEDGIRLYRMI